MANANSFPLVRGRTMRVTKTDGCGQPDFGDDNSITTDGFVSVALSAQITDAEEITVTNANGRVCVRDTGSATFDGYGVEIAFCEVQPCLFSLITGQPVVTNAVGDIVGFKMNSQITLDQSGFGLEVWMGVPGVACEGDAGASGYLLLPSLQGGVIGDFTVENAAITFTISGAVTKDGNGWGVGPYADTELTDPLDVDDHLYVIFTTDDPPEATDGCVTLVPINMSVVNNDPDVDLNIPTGNDDCWDGGVEVDWGDGSSVESVAAATATVNHVYVNNGSYDIVVNSTDGECGPVTFTVTITGGVDALMGAAARTATRKTAAKKDEPKSEDAKSDD